jgi:hypothetical protein
VFTDLIFFLLHSDEMLIFELDGIIKKQLRINVKWIELTSERSLIIHANCFLVFFFFSIKTNPVEDCSTKDLEIYI